MDLAENFRIIGNHEESLTESEVASDKAVEAEYPYFQRLTLHYKGIAYIEMNSMTEAIEAADDLKQSIEEKLKRRRIIMDRSGWSIIGVAIIWAAVIFAASFVLKGTPYWGKMLPILGGGAAASIIVLGGTRRKRSEKS